MVSMSSLHSLTAEIHGGMLMLAFACIMVVAISQFVAAYRKRFPDILVNIALKVRGYAEPTGYVAAVGGVIGLFLSTYTGAYAWPQEDLLLSEEVRNKITLTVFSTVLWCVVVFIRMRFGRGLWACPAMAVVYTALAAVAMAVTGATGSVGAHLTKGESLLDPFWEMLKVEIGETFLLDPTIAAILALAGAIAVLFSLAYARKERLFDVVLGTDTCQKLYKWDEPTIHTDQKKEDAPDRQ